MANTAYSKEFRDRVIQSVLNRGTRSLRDIAREFGMGRATLSEWLCNENIFPQKDEQQFVPELWSGTKKLQTISLFDALSEEERGEFLRKSGITSIHIQRWRQDILTALEKRDQEKIRLEKRVRQLERDLDKKDKALAEAAALLILQKKTQRLFKDEN